MLGLPLKDEAIIVVNGFVKASTWTIAAFLGSSSSQQVTISGRLASAVDINIDYSSSETVACSPITPRSGPAHRMLPQHQAAGQDDPKDKTMPKDQCIFLNYYKIKHKRLPWAPKKLFAAAGPRYDGDGGYSDEEDGVKSLTTEPSCSEVSCDVTFSPSRIGLFTSVRIAL